MICTGSAQDLYGVWDRDPEPELQFWAHNFM